MAHYVFDPFWHSLVCYANSKTEALNHVKRNYNGVAKFKLTRARPTKYKEGIFEFII